MLSSFFVNFFLEIQRSLRQFLLEVNGVGIHGEILKKLCASHHVSETDSTRFPEKSYLSTKLSFPSIGVLKY